MLRTLLFVLACLGAPAVAYADMPGQLPPSCPPGSTARRGHGSSYCAPSPDCTSDAECGAGSRCERVSQCVETRGCGGRRDPAAPPCTVSHVVGPCDRGQCATGTCTQRRVCTAARPTGQPMLAGGCAVIGGGRPIAAWILAIAALIGTGRALRRKT